MSPGGVSDHLEVVQMIGWTGCVFQEFSLAAGMISKGKSLAAGAILKGKSLATGCNFPKCP